MANDWKEYKLKDLISIKHGYAFKGSYISTEDNGIVLVTPGNFAIGGGFQETKCKFYTSDYPEDYILKENDLIVTMTDLSKEGDTLGYSAKIPKSKRIYLHNQRIGLVEIHNSEIDKEFLYWYMRTKNYQKSIVNSCSGSVIKHTSPGRICDLEILLPPLETQQKIAKVLSALDDKIELNNKINENLEQQARMIFIDLFGEAISDVKNRSNEPFANLVNNIDNRGKTPPCSTEKTNFPIIDVRALSGNTRIINYNNCTKYVSEETYNTWFRNGHPQKYDILLSTVGSLAEMKLFMGDIGCIAQNVVGYRCKISPFYLYQYLNYIKNDLLAYDIGSVQPSIKVTHIAKHPVYIPQDKQMQNFHDIAESMTKQIYANSKENRHLTHLCDTLLPKLMSGIINIENAAIEELTNEEQ